MNDTGMMRRTCRCGHPGWTHYARFGPQECLMPGCDCDGFLAEKDGGANAVGRGAGGGRGR